MEDIIVVINSGGGGGNDVDKDNDSDRSKNIVNLDRDGEKVAATMRKELPSRSTRGKRQVFSVLSSAHPFSRPLACCRLLHSFIHAFSGLFACRLSALLNEEEEADEEFWGQQYFREEEGDEGYQSAELLDEEEHVVDSDFDLPEDHDDVEDAEDHSREGASMEARREVPKRVIVAMQRSAVPC